MLPRVGETCRVASARGQRQDGHDGDDKGTHTHRARVSARSGQRQTALRPILVRRYATYGGASAIHERAQVGGQMGVCRAVPPRGHDEFL